jgi:hypothetical protein
MMPIAQGLNRWSQNQCAAALVARSVEDLVAGGFLSACSPMARSSHVRRSRKISILFL